MKLSLYVRYADDNSDSTIDMPIGDDAELSVRIFGVVLRGGTLPDMTQTRGDGTEFFVNGGGRSLSEAILSWDRTDEPEPEVVAEPDVPNGE